MFKILFITKGIVKKYLINPLLQFALLNPSITIVNICEESFNHFDIRPSKKSGPLAQQH